MIRENKPISVYSAVYDTWIVQGESLLTEYEESKQEYSRHSENRFEDDWDLEYTWDSEPYDYEQGAPTDEQVEVWLDEEYKKGVYIDRDIKGRLLKGSMIAKKRSCDEKEIWWLYSERKYSVREIAVLRGCSKSTIYNVIKKYKDNLLF